MDRPGTLAIRTPEGVVFTYELAGPVSRCLAWLLDLVVIAVILFLIRKFFGIFSVVAEDLMTAATIAAYFLVLFGYPLLLEWFGKGQTLGKKLLRLRVIDAQGLRLHFSQILVRNLLRAIDAQPGAFYLIGGVAALLNRHGQRLGDLAANTVVIRHTAPGAPDYSRLLPDKYNSFRAHPHLGARLRQRVDPAAARVLLAALRRRDELDPAARLELNAALAAHLRGLVEFPPAATDGLSDEQYLRNCVDLIYRPTA